MIHSPAALTTEDRTRLNEIVSKLDGSPNPIIAKLLRYGVEQLGVQNGHLTQINVGLGTHTIAILSGPLPPLSVGHTADLSSTYCRTVLASGDLCVVGDASNEGWADDPAYTSYGFATYLGTKVVVDHCLYGTACFVDTDPHTEPFTAADEALVEAISRSIAAVLERRPDTQESEERIAPPFDLLRRTQVGTQVGGWELECRTNELAITEEFYRIFEIPADETLTLDDFLRFFDSAGCSRLRNAFEQCREAGVSFTFELSITTARDNRRQVRLKGEPKSDDEEITHLIGTVQDVTPPYELEDHLRQTRARLKALFEQSPLMINVHDGAGNLLDPNPRLCEETGYTEEELTDMKVWDVDQSVDPERVPAPWTEMGVGDQKKVEGTYRRRDGSTFPVEVHLRHLDVDGEPHFMAISQNVTDRKQEQRRREQIISRVTDAIVEVDADWCFTLVNEQAEALYDRKESDLLGENFWDVFSEALDTRLERAYRRVMQTRRSARLTEYYSGLGGWFDIQVYPNEDGGLAFYFDDVTEQKEREQRLDAIFNHTYQFTGLMAPDGTLLEVNDTALTFGGVDEADVLGKPLWETHWAQTGEESKERLRRAIDQAARGEFVRYERPIRGQENERIVDFSIRPVQNEQGEVTLLVPEARDITERKNREEALRDERNLLERIFQTSPTAITVLNKVGQFVRVSDRAREILGLEKDEVTDRRFNDPEWHVTAPSGGPFPTEKLPFSQVKNTGESVYAVEHAIEWPDGSRRLLSVSGAPLHDADGSFMGAVFHLDDITERRKAKKELRKSEQQFRGVFRNAGLGIALCNEEGVIVEANPALERMLGYDAAQLAGTHFEVLTHPDDLETDRRLYRDLVSGNRDAYQIEKRYLHQDGDAFWGRLTVSRQDAPDDVQIVAVVEDIDAEKQSKEELRKFKQVVEQAYDAVLITEGRPLRQPGPRITYVNPAFTQNTGYEPEDILGKTPRIMQGPQTEPWVLHHLRKKLEKEVKFEGEAINYKKDGTPYVNHWSIAPVYDENDTLTHWVSVQRDVTEERRMSQRLLEVQDEERRRIDQEIHDELGGLLTSLQMTLDLARIKIDDETAVIERLNDIETLIDQVSAVARTISRQLHPSVLDEYGLSEALFSLTGEMESRHDLTIELHNEVNPEERYSSLVETTAYRVVQEALLNVVRHAETTEAQVVVHTGERQLHVHVFDSGIGFNPSAPSDTQTFGLEGIRRRVNRLNGTLEVSSSPNEGTRVSATLPLTVATLKR